MTPQFKKKQVFEDIEKVIKSHKTKTAIHADSPEVLYTHYFERILNLKIELSKLNLLDHPCEIQSICNSVIIATNELNEIATKYKIKRHSPQPGHFVW